MSEQRRADYSTICTLIQNEISRCNLRIEQTEQNKDKLLKLQDAQKLSKNSIAYCDMVIDSLKPFANDIQEYITNKRKQSHSALNNALRLAGEIVPASMGGIAFKMEGDEAWLEMPNSALVEHCEGSGYKGAASLFLRSVVLAQNQHYLQTMVLDELLAKLSTERTALLSRYLPQMVKNQQIIIIEQKKEIYADCEATLYKFFKSDGFTTVTKEVQ